jgi:DNA polymerase V
MTKKIYALVDCNNFYASCERVFRPGLRALPVLVLSNNDGCVIARSQEVKDLGIAMGAPYFQLKDLIAKHNIQVFSSNFALYGDMSRRVKGVLDQFSPTIENYSVDESFLDLTEFAHQNLTQVGHTLRQRVLQWTGIPVSVGIATSKTLAKVANKIAKKNKDLGGVFDISGKGGDEIDGLLEQVEIRDIWGIGRQYTKKLTGRGILNAKQFKYMDTSFVQSEFSINGVKTVLELQGVACIKFEDIVKAKKGIACTRTFGQYVEYKKELGEAISLYTARAAEKLRGQHSIAGSITVFVETNWHNPKLPQYNNAHTIKLVSPTSYTPTLTKYALQALEEIFVGGYCYNKSGVILTAIIPEDRAPADLFSCKPDEYIAKQRAVSTSIDLINRKWGRGTITSAAQGTTHTWFMRQEKRSPRYTTSWLELPTIQ